MTFREKEEKEEEEKEEEEDDDERESNRVAPCATKQVTTPRQWMVVRFVLRPTRPPQWTTWTLHPRRTGRWKETMYMHLPDTSQWPTPFIHPRPPLHSDTAFLPNPLHLHKAFLPVPMSFLLLSPSLSHPTCMPKGTSTFLLPSYPLLLPPTLLYMVMVILLMS